MKKKYSGTKKLNQPPLEHFQPTEEDMGEDQDEEKRDEGVDGLIPPLPSLSPFLGRVGRG